MKTQVPNWVNNLLDDYKNNRLNIKPGAVQVLEVFHDDDCPQLKSKGSCSCDPEINIVDMKEDKVYYSKP